MVDLFLIFLHFFKSTATYGLVPSLSLSSIIYRNVTFELNVLSLGRIIVQRLPILCSILYAVIIIVCL